MTQNSSARRMSTRRFVFIWLPRENRVGSAARTTGRRPRPMGSIAWFSLAAHRQQGGHRFLWTLVGRVEKPLCREGLSTELGMQLSHLVSPERSTAASVALHSHLQRWMQDTQLPQDSLLVEESAVFLERLWRRFVHRGVDDDPLPTGQGRLHATEDVVVNSLALC